MSEFHVQVIKIDNIEPHDNADSLSISMIHGGYPVIFRTGDFKLGDSAVYIPIDSVVPENHPQFAFLGTHRRIKAKKLRGVFSMGLLIKSEPHWVEGQNVQAELGITKWEPVEEFNKYGHRPGHPLFAGEDEIPPSFLQEYTDLEGLRKFSRVLEEGEEVIITEKIHGACVFANTKVTMHDGTKKKISEIKIGEFVLGVNDKGQVIPNKVLHTYNNGHAEEWLDVIGTRNKLGGGNSFSRVRCTKEHKFWSPVSKTYVLANELKIGDSIVGIRHEIDLSPIQFDVILGKLLGDGSLRFLESTASISWGHVESDKKYGEWTNRALGSLVQAKEDIQISGYGSLMHRNRTIFNVWIKKHFHEFVRGGTKIVPSWVANLMTPLTIAFWYMDDGSLNHHEDQEDRASFATCAFTKVDCEVLINGLAKFEIKANYRCYDGYSRIVLDSYNAERLFLLIAPYVPPCMQRKLPERYRGGPGWLPQVEQGEFRPLLVNQTVKSIQLYNGSHVSKKYDLETETHNYFANQILVHNSSRYVYKNNRLWVGSRTRVKKENDEIPWWKAAKQYHLEEKLSQCPNIAFYGELYGKVQDLNYGINGLALLFFDAKDTTTQQYLNYDEFMNLASKLNLPTVPLLYRGAWSNELRSLANGQSMVSGADHIREGFVAKPIQERWDRRVGRVILKLVGEDYLLR